MPLNERMIRSIGFGREAVARRVVRRADKQQPGIRVRRGEQFVRIEREPGFERDFAHFDVVDGGGHFVHAVGRGDRDGVVPSRFTENAEHQVDRFVRAVADEDPLRCDALDFGDAPFERLLVRVGVAVVSVFVGAFVGVEVDAQFALVLVPCGGIGGEAADIVSEECAYVHVRHRVFSRTDTALRWASSPSAAAIVSITGPMARRPSGDIS